MRIAEPAARTALLALACAGLAAALAMDEVRSLDEALPRDGRPALVVFFATGCPPCADDLLDAAAFVRREGLAAAVIGVCGDPEPDIRGFIEKHSLACPVVRDVRGRIRRRFGVDLLPMKIVLDRGREVHRDDSYLPLDERMRRVERCLIELAGGSRSGSRSRSSGAPRPSSCRPFSWASWGPISGSAAPRTPPFGSPSPSSRTFS